MQPGCDSSFAGTTADFNSAAAAGIVWWGHYFGGAGVYRVWSNAERTALFNSRIPKHLPIWVPDQRFISNPYNEALAAVTAARALGIKSVFAFDVEANSGYKLTWGESFCTVVRADGFKLICYHSGDKQPPSNSFDWLADWTGNPPQSLGEYSAQQYRGATQAYGMSVDFDMAGISFPLEINPNIQPPTQEDDLLTSLYDPNLKQQHVWRDRSDGQLDHWYRGESDTQWHYELIPNHN